MEEKNLIELPDKVANYLEFTKEKNYTLKGALNVVIGKGETKKFMESYLGNGLNQEKFALAWLNGHKREEKIFLVKVKNCTDACYLNYSTENKNFFFSNSKENERHKTKFTKTFLEENGFGWVFNCEGVQIIEVEKND